MIRQSVYTHFKQTVSGNAIALFPLLIFLGFCIFISLAPIFDLIPWVMGYDEKRIIQLIILLISACWVLISHTATVSFIHLLFSLPRLSQWLLAIIISLGIISSLQAPSSRYASMELSIFVLLSSFSFAVGALVQRFSVAVIISLLTTIAISAFLYEVTFFSSYVGILAQGHPFKLPEPFSGFSSVRFFNQFQIWTLPLIVLPLCLYKRLYISIRGILVILAIGWWVLLFASQSRGAQLAIATAVIITLIFFRKGAWPVIKTTLLTAIGGWVAYLFLFIYIPNLETKTRLAQLTDDPARLQLWQMALDMIYENPWLGVGPMHYAYFPNDIAAHPHNALLQIAAEWGLPVTIIMIALAGWGIYAWHEKYFKNADSLKSNNRHHLWIGLFCSLTAGMTYAMVSGVIVTPMSQTIFAVITGTMLGLYHTKPSTLIPSTIQTSVLRVITVTMIIGSLWALLPEITLKLGMAPQNPQGKTAIFGPRFWQEGGIPH